MNTQKSEVNTVESKTKMHLRTRSAFLFGANAGVLGSLFLLMGIMLDSYILGITLASVAIYISWNVAKVFYGNVDKQGVVSK